MTLHTKRALFFETNALHTVSLNRKGGLSPLTRGPIFGSKQRLQTIRAVRSRSPQRRVSEGEMAFKFQEELFDKEAELGFAEPSQSNSFFPCLPKGGSNGQAGGSRTGICEALHFEAPRPSSLPEHEYPVPPGTYSPDLEDPLSNNLDEVLPGNLGTDTHVSYNLRSSCHNKEPPAFTTTDTEVDDFLSPKSEFAFSHDEEFKFQQDYDMPCVPDVVDPPGRTHIDSGIYHRMERATGAYPGNHILQANSGPFNIGPYNVSGLVKRGMRTVEEFLRDLLKTMIPDWSRCHEGYKYVARQEFEQHKEEFKELKEQFSKLQRENSKGQGKRRRKG